MNTVDLAPTRKVTAGALAGALTVILVFMLREYASVELPGEVASSVTTVFTFLTSYFVRD